jgi:serine/threonine protein kinase
MPLVPGGDLKERFSEFAASPGADRAALRIVAELLASVSGAVAFLHERGILHRDLKPSNILLATPDGREPLVGDFGLAERLEEEGPESPGVAGTPPYMAPEQMEGLPLTAGADVWSLGAVLHELLTGLPPFHADGRLDAQRKQAAEQPPPWAHDAAADTLERICLRCLQREITQRYPTARELADDLQRYLEE